MSIQISELPVGSLIKDNSTTYYGEPIVWQILEHNHEGDPEGTTTIQTNKIITFKPADGIEPTSDFLNASEYGDARYEYSNIRQWLNSDDIAGEWFTPQTESDTAPSIENVNDGKNAYDNENGFLYNFGNEFKTAVIESSRKSHVYTDSSHHTDKMLSDKIFILSERELNIPQVITTEGTTYEYFLNKSGDDIARYATEDAISNDESGEYDDIEKKYIMLTRTYTGTNYSLAWGESNLTPQIGELITHGYYPAGIAPATCITSTYSVEDEPDEDGVYTIDWSIPPQPTPETFVKYKRYIQQNGEKVLTSLWTHADSVEVDSDTTLTECIADMNDRISEIPRFDIQVVDELPTEDISTTTVYLVRNQEQSGTNLYAEYIYVDDEWEFLGSADISLDDYYTKVQTDALLNGKLSSNGDASSTTVDFITSDVNENTLTPSSGYIAVDKLTGNSSLSTLMRNISGSMRNVRWINKLLGTTLISSFGDGTITGNISSLNTSLSNKADISQIAKIYSATDSYIVGDIVYKDGNLYKVNTAIGAGNWSDSSVSQINDIGSLPHGHMIRNGVTTFNQRDNILINGASVTDDATNNQTKIDFTSIDASYHTSTFANSDLPDSYVTTSTGWTTVSQLTSSWSLNSLFAKVSQMFKNVRWLYKMLGTTSISSVGNGTVTGAISTLNTSVSTTSTSLTNKLDKTSTVTAIWSGTQVEYDAISPKSSTTLYFIKES